MSRERPGGEDVPGTLGRTRLDYWRQGWKVDVVWYLA